MTWNFDYRPYPTEIRVIAIDGKFAIQKIAHTICGNEWFDCTPKRYNTALEAIRESQKIAAGGFTLL